MKKWIISAKTSRTVGKVYRSCILLIFLHCIAFMPVPCGCFHARGKAYEPDISESLAKLDSADPDEVGKFCDDL
ncbi:MAG: hypothetical protein ACLVEX_15155 [Ruthenibacterium lactatiformans]